MLTPWQNFALVSQRRGSKLQAHPIRCLKPTSAWKKKTYTHALSCISLLSVILSEAYKIQITKLAVVKSLFTFCKIIPSKMWWQFEYTLSFVKLYCEHAYLLPIWMRSLKGDKFKCKTSSTCSVRTVWISPKDLQNLLRKWRKIISSK